MQINYIAVVVCAVAALVIGMIWYGKALFGKTWMKITGMENMTPEAQAAMKKKMGGMMFLQFIMSLVSVYVLARFINMSGMSGVTMAFWIWLGFLMPTAAGSAIWSGKSGKLAWSMFFVTAGAELVTFLVFGLILGAWH